MLGNFLYKQNVISFNACAAHLGCFLAFMTAECLLLASTAYDWYVAICNPLLYMVVMSPGICIQLVAAPIATASWLLYFIPSSPSASPTVTLISSTISTVTTCPSSGWLAPTRTPSSSGSLPVRVSCSFLPFWLSLYPTCTLSLPSWGCAQLKEDAKPSPMQLPHADSHHILWDSHLHVLTAKL